MLELFVLCILMNPRNNMRFFHAIDPVERTAKQAFKMHSKSSTPNLQLLNKWRSRIHFTDQEIVPVIVEPFNVAGWAFEALIGWCGIRPIQNNYLEREGTINSKINHTHITSKIFEKFDCSCHPEEHSGDSKEHKLFSWEAQYAFFREIGSKKFFSQNFSWIHMLGQMWLA